ncbi:PPOX class F420-dependent oxidoreductase [Amycolatopsis sp. K13G38]|uniref:PPOX class F420-dependent oxidoreductase n=1 Tax=Amycolatopsis acididurans TaxID=2724524 RepID=A0ABX1IY62_9PSEU|nr:PPOX class F420-dependent oxidoreductase [Amycolatopsis acididurans]NKQ52091.1 PPOX class F420-dependent oxidoreductase [Amycolatopsis acididurans]
MTTTVQDLARQHTILLTTFKRDGTPVGTPVNLAVEDDHGYFRTYDKAWKARRLRNNPEVTITPSTFGGTPTGEPVRARATLLSGDEARHAARLLTRKHPLLHGVLVPLAHKLKGYRTLHYRVELESV